MENNINQQGTSEGQNLNINTTGYIQQLVYKSRNSAMLSVALVFGVNDVLALRSFNTFLNNFQIHEKPNFIERWAAKKAQGWIQSRAMKIFKDVRREVAEKQIDVALNNCDTGMFATLSLATQLSFDPKAGDELFLAIAAAELAFNKLKTPRTEETYK